MRLVIFLEPNFDFGDYLGAGRQLYFSKTLASATLGLLCDLHLQLVHLLLQCRQIFPPFVPDLGIGRN